jgi:hypothetical protein
VIRTTFATFEVPADHERVLVRRAYRQIRRLGMSRQHARFTVLMLVSVNVEMRPNLEAVAS